jgi:hypothetical protein
MAPTLAGASDLIFLQEAFWMLANWDFAAVIPAAPATTAIASSVWCRLSTSRCALSGSNTGKGLGKVAICP